MYPKRVYPNYNPESDDLPDTGYPHKSKGRKASRVNIRKKYIYKPEQPQPKRK